MKSAESPEASRVLGGSTVQVDDLTVDFGNFRALNSISVEFTPGRVHALLGQNGAGKTTLSRCLLGLVTPTTGSIKVAGESIEGRGVPVARAVGIDMVHQAFTFPPSMTVAEAMEFYRPSSRGIGLYRKATMEKRWQSTLSEMGVDVDPGATIGNLPVQTVQSLEIARALMGDARVLILDEPTSNIAPQDAQALFSRIRSLSQLGLTIIVVLHKVREVLDVADTVTVLREGTCVVAAQPASDFTEIGLSQAIIGERVDTPNQNVVTASSSAPDGHPILELERASSVRMDGDGDRALVDASIRVESGSIVGVAGVEGNGQVTLVNCLMGLRSMSEGRILMSGQDMTEADVAARRRMGLRAIPFERTTEGVSLTRSLWENVAAGWLVSTPRTTPFIRPSRLRAKVVAALNTWRVAYRSERQKVSELSGGNIQRLIFAREIDGAVRCLIAAQPTRGLDIQATSFVHDTLRELRKEGVGVLLVSSDLDELLSLCDVIFVMRAGALNDRFESPFSIESIGASMVGAS